VPDTDVLVVGADGPVRVVTLNRPAVLNATNEDMHRELSLVWGRLAADPDARAVVLTGAGTAFSAGGDIDFLQTMHDDPVARATAIGRDREIQLAMMRFPLPLIAAVNGPAVGLGCSLALGCDIVLLSDAAYLADPHVAIGLVAGDGGAALWPLLTSLSRAKEFLLTGDRLSADVAVQLGLASRVVPAASLMDEALALAHRLAARPTTALRATKRALNLHLEQAAVGPMELALEAEAASMTSDDFARGLDDLRQRINKRKQG
jgi:enoyl-CoA hydratase